MGSDRYLENQQNHGALAAEREREECARIVDRHLEGEGGDPVEMLQAIAREIRARGKPSPQPSGVAVPFRRRE